MHPMFIRKKKNPSGSISIQLIQKVNGTNKILKVVGSATTRQEIEELVNLAKQEIETLSAQPKLFNSENDNAIEQSFALLSNSNIRTLGPEIVFGKIYDNIGFGAIKEDMFRHLVIARLAFPLSKLKTIEYLYRYLGISLDIDAVYRFLDKLNSILKPQVEKIAFEHTKKILKGNISVVFYNMTIL